MSTSKQLDERLSALRRRRSGLRLWRGVREPFRILSTRGARKHGGRWHPPGVPALYASFEPSTVRAEMVRTAELQGDPEAAIYPVRLAEIAVDAETIELIDPDLLHDLGVQTPVSVLTPRSETQRVGAAAIRLGIEALVIPSVAVRADNVVIFPDNLAAGVEVVQERRVSSPGRWP